MHALRHALIELRLKRGFSQAQLARQMGINRTFVVKMEKDPDLVGKKRSRGVTMEEAASWAEACGGRLVLVDPEAEDLGELTEDERRLVESCRGADEEQRGLLLRIAGMLSKLDERDIAHLQATLDVAARGSSSSAPGGEVHLGRRSCG